MRVRLKVSGGGMLSFRRKPDYVFTDEIENGFQFQTSRLSESMGERQEGG
jgi:hypothetical protein